MKRDRLGRFLSPGAAGQRGGSGGGCGSGRARGRPSRSSGPSVDRAAAFVAAARACGNAGEDGADEAGGSGRSRGPARTSGQGRSGSGGGGRAVPA
jgi:hypothetical protein